MISVIAVTSRSHSLLSGTSFEQTLQTGSQHIPEAGVEHEQKEEVHRKRDEDEEVADEEKSTEDIDINQDLSGVDLGEVNNQVDVHKEFEDACE